MTEQEFLNILESSLSGELPGQEISSNVQYYRDYIESEKRKKSEQEVMNELGNPRLIARTIIETFQLNHPGKHYNQKNSSYQSVQYEEGRTYQESFNHQSNQGKVKQMSERKFKLIAWAVGIGTILLLLLILGAVFWLGTIVLKVFVRFILPILIIAIGIGWIRNQIRR